MKKFYHPKKERLVTAVKFPHGFETGLAACAALHDNEHWAVYIALMENDASSIAYLAKMFDGTYHEISMIVGDLENGGLVESFPIYEEEIGGDLARIFCRVTSMGLVFYARLFDCVIPRRRSDLPPNYYKMQERRHEAAMKALREGACA